MDLSKIKYITQAGGKLSKELSSEFANICLNKGIEFYIMYGQTEATARMTYLPYELAKKKKVARMPLGGIKFLYYFSRLCGWFFSGFG